jgi:hypothetical protein
MMQLPSELALTHSSSDDFMMMLFTGPLWSFMLASRVWLCSAHPPHTHQPLLTCGSHSLIACCQELDQCRAVMVSMTGAAC